MNDAPVEPAVASAGSVPQETITLPSTVVRFLATIGSRLVQFNSVRQAWEINHTVAFPLALQFADGDPQRAALLYESLSEALNDWNEMQARGGDAAAYGVPVP